MKAQGIGCRILPVTITSGNTATPQSVPRETLITKMQLMVEAGELEIASGCRHGEALRDELTHLSLDRAGGRGQLLEGGHDDLALALCLACWRAKIR